MARLCETEGLTDDPDRDPQGGPDSSSRRRSCRSRPSSSTPTSTRTEIVEGLKELGIFGLMIPEEYGGLGESLLTYALCVEEIARGWMSVSGVINTHFIVAYMLMQHGTEEQKQKYLPRMATGEVRGAFSMSEPGLGSDVSAIRTKATRTDDGYEITGQKMWLTNGGTSNLVAVLVKTDEGADSVYKNMTTFLVEKEAGFGETAQGVTIPGKIDKMGYKGVDTTEAIFEGHRISADQVLGGEPGKGFYQMMDGVEVGRVNVAARALRHRQPGLRARHRLRPAARDLRQADRRAPGDPVPARGDGDQGRDRARDDGPRGPASRTAASATTSRPAWRSMLAAEYCNEVVAGLVPDPRRLRLLQGVRDRAPLPRGGVHADRRGHRRHPEDDHRPQPAQGLQLR